MGDLRQRMVRYYYARPQVQLTSSRVLTNTLNTLNSAIGYSETIKQGEYGTGRAPKLDV